MTVVLYEPDPFAPRAGDRWIGTVTTLTVLSVDTRGDGHAMVQMYGAIHKMTLFDLTASLVDSVAIGMLWAPRSPGWA